MTYCNILLSNKVRKLFCEQFQPQFIQMREPGYIRQWCGTLGLTQNLRQQDSIKKNSYVCYACGSFVTCLQLRIMQCLFSNANRISLYSVIIPHMSLNCMLLPIQNQHKQYKLLCLLSFKYVSQHGQFWKLENFTRKLPILAEANFSHVTRLNQSLTSKNICGITITVFDNFYLHSQSKILILQWKICWMTLSHSLQQVRLAFSLEV